MKNNRWCIPLCHMRNKGLLFKTDGKLLYWTAKKKFSTPMNCETPFRNVQITSVYDFCLHVFILHTWQCNPYLATQAMMQVSHFPCTTGFFEKSLSKSMTDWSVSFAVSHKNVQDPPFCRNRNNLVLRSKFLGKMFSLRRETSGHRRLIDDAK